MQFAPGEILVFIVVFLFLFIGGFDTPLGRLVQVICYDADFPALMDQLHEQRARLFVAPSGDWRAISPYHSYMAAARSVENGAALLRPVTGGMSIATDPYGRILAADDYFADDRHYLVADIPMAEVRTLYARWGNWTVWVSGMLLIVGGVSSWRQESEV